MSSPPRVVVDCRWLDSGGAGRVTELLLRGLARRPDDFRWVLWGPASVEGLAWPGAEMILEHRDPRTWHGQRSWFGIPSCDLVLFMHQQRPLRPVPSATFIHDTIPLRFAAGALSRVARQAFLKRVARISCRVVTPSEHSRRSVVADLAIDPDRVTAVQLPADPQMARRVGELRRAAARQDTALYLGLFLPHKNLQRLIKAFAGTSFRREGGKLLLIGGLPRHYEEFTEALSPEQRSYVETRPFVGQAEVEEALATCRFLVQPSLEEGFGLPAWEALACGVPVCASDGGALPEVTRGWADEFPADSVERMRAAIDACALRSASLTPDDAETASRKFLDQTTKLEDFAGAMVEVIERCLSTPGV
jgi:glycosyltransferase involved in cell wall biosynthesis